MSEWNTFTETSHDIAAPERMQPWKIVIFVMDLDWSEYNKYVNLLQYFTVLGEIQVVGVSSNICTYEMVDDYPFISLEQIPQIEMDIFMVALSSYVEICTWAVNSEFIHAKYVFPMMALAIPGFHIHKYLKILDLSPTIVSNNCWGGITYHTLGLQMNSPFINMYFEDEDYIKLISDFETYMTYEPKYLRDEYEANLKRNFPICMLNDIVCYFNHYTSMEEVLKHWKRRVRRINWENIFFEMSTDNPEIARKFSDLNIRNGICFVPAEMETKDVFGVVNISVAKGIVLENNHINHVMTSIAGNSVVAYDVIYYPEIRESICVSYDESVFVSLS